MNRVKLTIEEFRNYKKNLLDLAIQAENFYKENKKNLAKTTKFMDETKKKYNAIQKELFSYDLSLIPFEEWDGLEITELANLSGTNANIDFSILKYYGSGSFHGCNVKNLEYIKRYINEVDFDKSVVKNNPDLFLSDNFDSNFKQKYYSHSLLFKEIFQISIDQWEELTKKDVMEHFLYSEHNNLKLLEVLGYEKLKALYNHSIEAFNLLLETLEYSSLYNENLSLIELLKNAEIYKIRDCCFKYIKKSLFKDSANKIDIKILPKVFVENNKKLLLIDESIPEELRERFYNRDLKIKEVFDNIELFEDIDIEFFIGEKSYSILKIAKTIGYGNFKILIKKFPEELIFLLDRNVGYSFEQYYYERYGLEDDFIFAIKRYITYNNNNNNNNNNDYDYFNKFKNMNFKFIREISNIDDLMNCDNRTIIINNHIQRHLIDSLGIDLIKKIEMETGIFSYKNSYLNDLGLFNLMANFFKSNSKVSEDIMRTLRNYDIEKFDEILAIFLDEMRVNNQFSVFLNYDWIDGNFREEHPEIFIDKDAPEELKNAFYENKITLEFLQQHKEYIPYLLDKDLSKIILANIYVSLPPIIDEWDFTSLSMDNNFIKEYSIIYGNKKTLELITKYGDTINNIVVESANGEIYNEKSFEKIIRKKIYQKIIKSGCSYKNLLDIPEFIDEYPDLFINLDNINDMSQSNKNYYIKKFYDGVLDFDDIRNAPQLKQALKDKNLLVIFSKTVNKSIFGVKKDKSPIQHLLTLIGNEKFLDLCSSYGNYLLYFDDFLYYNQFDFTNFKKNFEKNIANLCIEGEIPYTENAPEFLKNDYPNLFLDAEAPEELKKYFYGSDNDSKMTFEILNLHKEWIPYLENKAITTAILKTFGKSPQLKMQWKRYFELFGNENGVKLGIHRTETVTKMIEARQVSLMKQWYDRTGRKFIPDFVVMQNFKIEEADKFLISGNNWSTLMRLKNYSHLTESRDAMLKLAYSFGAFDHDKRGFNQLLELLVGVPRKIDTEFGYVIDRIDKDINLHSLRKDFFTRNNDKESAYNDMINYIKSKKFSFIIDNNTLLDLFETIKKEITDFDFSQDIFSQLYRKNEDNSYTLTINQQSCPKLSEIIRNILERFRELPLLTPDIAHQLCGGFDLKYDPYFRQFFLENLTEIVNNYEYTTYLSRIQKQFHEIKVANNNRTLTLELAKSFVQSNRYTNVNVGNEKLAEISAIAGYDQEVFDKLQEIYNYGKQRVYSSIPRIVKTSGIYTCEMLRLDDPLALAIGTLTDCCQELGNVAEMCMEHSMTDKNGRIFVIKDNEGNIISQSWVWRNKDVLCFDNIEIPDKVLTKISRRENDSDRKKFTDEIYNIYKMAADDLIKIDENKYKELLEQGKITKEQYEQLRLRKITVGLGYNDIAESLKRKASFDLENLVRPLPFDPPVELTRGLYTNDSNTQYVISKRDNQVENTINETLSIHSDDYIEYTDENFTNKLLLMLKKLEFITNDINSDDAYIYEEKYNDKKIITSLARQYQFLPERTRIIINSNMAIIYEVRDDKIILGDLFFNTKINNGDQQLDIEIAVMLQIWLALEQIKAGKKIDTSLLNSKQKNMYNKIVNLVKELNLESGVDNAKHR